MVYRVYEVCKAASQDGFFFFQVCTMNVRYAYRFVHLRTSLYTSKMPVNPSCNAECTSCTSFFKFQ